MIEKLGLNNLDIKISASGCPNSCSISHLSDIGFIGVVESEVDKKKCRCCRTCIKACRVGAIKIENKIAVIDLKKCKNCGMCIQVCLFGAIYKKQEGIAILAGGRGPGFMQDKTIGETRLGVNIIDFIDKNLALQITEKILKLVKEKDRAVAEIIDELGLENFKEAVL